MLEKESKRGPELEPPDKLNRYIKMAIAGVIALAVVIAAIAIPIVLLNRSQKERRELEGELAEAERLLQLQEDVAAEHQSQIDALQEKVEELLRVEDAPPVITRDQLEDQLNSLRELVTKEYIYKNAARQEASKTWLWGWTMPFSDASLLVTYDGAIKAGINLNEVKIDVNEENRTITVTVPASKVTDNIIPQETIDVLEVKDGLFNRITFEDYNEFISEEKPKMEEQAIARGLLADADAEAKAAIKAFLSLVPGMDTYELIVQ